MAATEKEKKYDPGVSPDDSGKSEEENNLGDKSHGCPPTSEALEEVRVHNDLQTRAKGGPQADQPAEATGGKPAKKKGKKEERKECRGCGKRVKKVYTADETSWMCREEHGGLCLTCWKKDTCPVCPGGDMLPRLTPCTDPPPD